jgi:hypothetical protein
MNGNHVQLDDQGREGLTRQLELLFADENMRFDQYLSKSVDELGFCGAGRLANHPKVT